MSLKFSKEEDAFWAIHEKYNQAELLATATLFKKHAMWIHRRIGYENTEAAKRLEVGLKAEGIIPGNSRRAK